LAFPEEEIPFELKLLREGGEGTSFDQLGSHHGKSPFLSLGKFLEEKVTDREIED
jgi:hypothetical protein